MVKKFLMCAMVLLGGLVVEAQYIRAFGDSFTEGIGAVSSKSYPANLSKLLNVVVVDSGFGYQTSTEVVNRIIADDANKSNATIIWCGRNNYDNIQTVLYDIDRAVASLGHNRYLVLPTWASSEPQEDKGTAKYNNIMELNRQLSDKYGNHYVPVREVLVNAYDPNIVDDSISFIQDRVASHLRFQNGLHPNDKGYYEIAKILSHYSVELGFDALPGRWLGIYSSDINNPLNWKGGVPTSNTDVTIHADSTVLYFPAITGTLNCRDFNVGRGVSLTITGTVKVAGHIVNMGNINASNGTIEMNGVPAQCLRPGTFVNNTVKNLVNNFRGQIPKGESMAFYSPISVGNDFGQDEIGMEFKVNDPAGLVIKQLGVFDHQANGITGTQNQGIRVAIFNATTKTIVPGLDINIAGATDPYIAGHRMRTISPVTLTAGNYVIVAKGYNSAELYGNHNTAGSPDYGIDDDGGRISFVATWFGNDTPNDFVFPKISYTEDKHLFLGGSFIFEARQPKVGTSLSAPLNVTGTVTPLSGVLDTHKFLTLKSSGVSTARIAAGDSLGGYVKGEVTVERYIPQGKVAYRQLASGVTTSTPIFNHWQEGKPATPVAGIGMHITGSTTGANGFDQTSGGGVSMFTYAAGAPAFTSIGNTNVKKLNALQAYRVFINGDRFANLTIPTTTNGTGSPNITMNNATTIRATGTLITGPVIFNSTAAYGGGVSDVNNKLSTVAGDFNMIANPYWSPVDFTLLTKNDVSETYWLWDPAIGNRGAYVTYNTLTGSTPGSNINRNIQPGQSIFIQTTGPNPSVRFDENAKTDTLTSTFRSINQSPSKLSVKLFTTMAANTGRDMQDGTMVAFRDDFNKTISREDAPKFTNSDENIAIFRDNQFLGVEGRPSVTSADTIALRIWRLYSNNSYVLRIQGSDFDANVSGSLIDRFLNKQYPLNMNGSLDLPFAYSADSASFFNRFMVVFRSATVLPLSVTSIRAYKKATGVQVEWNVTNETESKEYIIERSTDGRAFNYVGAVTATGNNRTDVSYTWFDRSPVQADNFYRIKAVGLNGSTLYTNVVKVNLAGKTIFVSTFPNPVKGRQFTVQLDGFERGNYTAKLIDQLGQEVFRKAIYITSSATNEEVMLGANVSAGIYTLVINNGQQVMTRQQLSIH